MAEGNGIRIPNWIITSMITFSIVLGGGLVTWGTVKSQLASAQILAQTASDKADDIVKYREEKLVKKDELKEYKNSTNQSLDKIDQKIDKLIDKLIPNN